MDESLRISAARVIDTFISGIVVPFRKTNRADYRFVFTCLQEPQAADWSLDLLSSELLRQGITVQCDLTLEAEQALHVSCSDLTQSSSEEFSFPLTALSEVISLAALSGLSCRVLAVMQVIAWYICRKRTLRKAIVLDLDDTLWPGTLAEEKPEQIAARLQTQAAEAYLALMRWVKALAQELGIFVAIASRNSREDVEAVLKLLTPETFPLKDEIDCIVVTGTDKSDCLKTIADELSLLPSALVFIDDNPLNRDEVKAALPEVLVPEWDDPLEIILQLTLSGVFRRHELTVNSRSRRERMKILNMDRRTHKLHEYSVEVSADINHCEAERLYAKSNQFKLMTEDVIYDGVCSLYFKLEKKDGTKLGICAALTYQEINEETVCILNLALSCRFFTIGLEEFVILYLMNKFKHQELILLIDFNEDNLKAQKFVQKYECQLLEPLDSEKILSISALNKETHLLINKMMQHKNFKIFKINPTAAELLHKNTSLKLIS